MDWIRKRRPAPGTIFGLAALVIALGGVAFAAIPDSGGTIHGCYQRNGGNLRVAESAADCRSSERAISWNQQGDGHVQTLQRTTLHDGETSVLLSKGPIRLDARCQLNHPVGDSETRRDSAEVLVSTTEEHTAVSGEYTGGVVVVEIGPLSQPHVLRQVLSYHAVGHPESIHPNYNTTPISVSTPSGTDITAELYVGANTFGQLGTCSFGGYVVSS